MDSLKESGADSYIDDYDKLIMGKNFMKDEFAYFDIADMEPVCEIDDLVLAESQLNEIIRNAVLLEEGDE